MRKKLWAACDTSSASLSVVYKSMVVVECISYNRRVLVVAEELLAQAQVVSVRIEIQNDATTRGIINANVPNVTLSKISRIAKPKCSNGNVSGGKPNGIGKKFSCWTRARPCPICGLKNDLQAGYKKLNNRIG